MIKLFSLLLSSLILIQSFGFNLNTILQIDEIIEHAQYHNEKYQDNVIVFISKHYGALKKDHDKTHEEEKGDHEQLPFHHHSDISSLTVFVLNTQKEELKTLEFCKLKTHSFFYQAPVSSLHLDGLLQPPRQS